MKRTGNKRPIEPSHEKHSSVQRFDHPPQRVSGGFPEATAPLKSPERVRDEEPPPAPSETTTASTQPQTDLPDAALSEAPGEADHAANSAPEPPPRETDALEALIEAERVHLIQVHAVLRCLYDVLLYADDDDSTMHADVAHVCAFLIEDCVGRLEAIVHRYRTGEFHAPHTPAVSKEAEHSPTIQGSTDEVAEDES